jgi:tetratricopeptide (TPR) repeat protein
MKSRYRIRESRLGCAIGVILFIFTFPLSAQDLPELSLSSGMGIPMGANAGMYTYGVDVGLNGSWALPFFPMLGLAARVGYDYVPTAGGSQVNLISGAAGIDINLLSLDFFSFKLTGLGGYSYYMHATASNSGGGFYYIAGAQASFAFSRAFALGVGASYQSSLGRYDGLIAGVSASLALGDTTVQPKMKIDSITIDPLFPVFLKWYDSNPAGKLILSNGESVSARNVTVSLFIKQFMDSPRTSPVIPEVRSGQKIEVPVYALLSDSVLSVTEAMKLPAEITVTYDAVEKGMKISRTETVRIENRNAMNWSDDRRAASFVTPKDPTVLRFTKSLAGRLRAMQNQPFELNFRVAMALLESLKQYGVGYVVDPASSYAENSAKQGVVDYLQFPRQTLEYRSGDCDDLSILYCSLLESVGIETAFVTVPGHIFAAFALGMTPDEAKRSFSRTNLYVVSGGKVWIPVEVTLVGSGFMTAWLRGCQGWTQGGANAHLYPVQDAWSVYEAVGIRSEEASLSYPAETDVVSGFQRELAKTVAMEIGPQEEKMKSELAQNGSPKNLNNLGALYARFGMMDNAQTYFKQAAAANYIPAMHNMGSAAFSLKDFQSATTWYGKVVALDGKNAMARIGLARSLFESGRITEAYAEYDRARAIDPTLAAKYAYLDSGTAGQGGARASDASMLQNPEYIVEE